MLVTCQALDKLRQSLPVQGIAELGRLDFVPADFASVLPKKDLRLPTTAVPIVAFDYVLRFSTSQLAFEPVQLIVKLESLLKFELDRFVGLNLDVVAATSELVRRFVVELEVLSKVVPDRFAVEILKFELAQLLSKLAFDQLVERLSTPELGQLDVTTVRLDQIAAVAISKLAAAIGARFATDLAVPVLVQFSTLEFARPAVGLRLQRLDVVHIRTAGADRLAPDLFRTPAFDCLAFVPIPKPAADRLAAGLYPTLVIDFPAVDLFRITGFVRSAFVREDSLGIDCLATGHDSVKPHLAIALRHPDQNRLHNVAIKT